MSKRYAQLTQQFDLTKVYTPSEAIELVKKMASAKVYDETVVGHHYRLALTQSILIRTSGFTVILPHGTGKPVRVLVLAKVRKLLKLPMLVLTM